MTVENLGRSVIAILLLSLLSACASVQRVSQVDRPSGPAPLMLWKVSSDDRPADGYILGSIHLGKSTDSQMDTAIREAYSECGFDR